MLKYLFQDFDILGDLTSDLADPNYNKVDSYHSIHLFTLHSYN